MNILFLGRFYPQKLIMSIARDSYGKVGMSNHNFEMSIVNGLCKQENINLQCVTLPAVYSFPHNNRRFFTKSEAYIHNGIPIYSIGFCNLVIIKELLSTILLIFRLIKVISKFKDNKRVNVIINTPNNKLLSAIKIARLFSRKQITQTVIIPDIPSMVTTMYVQNPIKRFLLRYFNKKSIKKITESDGLVLLTEAMMDFVNKPITHIIMEGIINLDTLNLNIDRLETSKEIILYTGTLSKIFGIMNLVEAFIQIPDKNIELWICGSGDSKQDIENVAKQDSRIKFFGLVDSMTALKFQRQATILVNPRTSDGEYTKYSFPSKTIEYLLCGKSVIINRLPGIPEEYYEFVHIPKDESVKALSECISNVLLLNKSLRNEIALKGKNFIMSRKNSKVQTDRILKMISNY